MDMDIDIDIDINSLVDKENHDSDSDSESFRNYHDKLDIELFNIFEKSSNKINLKPGERLINKINNANKNYFNNIYDNDDLPYLDFMKIDCKITNQKRYNICNNSIKNEYFALDINEDNEVNKIEISEDEEDN